MRMTASPTGPSLVQASAADPLQDQADPPQRRSVLVVCYSRSGRTRLLAQQIAKQCRADFEEIIEVRRRRGLLGRLSSMLQALLGATPEIRESHQSPRDYDTVIIGTPVCARRMASPVRSYVQRHRGQFRRVACFCTYGGWGPANVPKDISKICGRPAAPTLALSIAELSRQRYWAAVAKFVRMVKRDHRATPQREAA
jgi:flavodoxin